ncbi:MAG: DUF1573 domain-containing protein [Gemmatimonadales bacterium]
MITSLLLILMSTLLPSAAPGVAQGVAQLLVAEPAEHDFGRVPLSGGNVTTRFVVTNRGKRAIRLRDVYTSCGCTTAELEFSDGTVAGPFGMPGHDLPVRYDRELEPGERVEVLVRFDPAAHGPQGVGRVTRAVVLKPVGAPPTEFVFTATVIQ